MISKLDLKLLEKGINREKFAIAIEVHYKTPANWINGHHKPKRIDTINKACEVLDMTPIEFMGLFSCQK